MQLKIFKFLTSSRVDDASRLGDWKKVTCNLLISCFTPEELNKCSVTGRQTKSSETPRPPLDADKVDAIVGEFHLFMLQVHSITISYYMVRRFLVM